MGLISSTPAIAPTPKAWAQAIATPAIEFPTTALPILAGAVPPGLRGTLYRNGPGRLGRGGRTVGHWFDGDGAILRVAFTGESVAAGAGPSPASGVTATYQYVQSAGYQAEAAAEQILYRGYGTLPAQPFWQRLKSQFKNAANTSVLALSDRLLALWEGGFPHQLDLATLETLGLDDLGSLVGDEPYSAHPKRHPVTGEIFNFGLVAGANATLNLYRSDATGRILKKHTVELNGIPLIHDFVLADRYLVFCVPPVRMNALPAVLGFRSFSDALMWQPRYGTQLLVVDADTCEVLGWQPVEPWFQWHFGKGYVDHHGHIVLEVVRYPNFTTNQNLKEIASGQMDTPAPSSFWRLHIDPQTAALIAQEELIDQHCEFPVVQSAFVTPEAAPTYCAIHRPQVDTTGEVFGAIARFDPTPSALTIADTGENRYPSEPIYAPDAATAGQGWVLTVVYDGNLHQSEVWIYDSDRLGDAPVCRLGLPQVIPHSFHGTWHPAQGLPRP